MQQFQNRKKLALSSEFDKSLDCKMIFESADRDHNGVISRDEFISLLAKVNKGIFRDQLIYNIIYGLVDLNQNGTIEYDEFEKLFYIIRENEQCHTFEGLCEILFRMLVVDDNDYFGQEAIKKLHKILSNAQGNSEDFVK